MGQTNEHKSQTYTVASANGLDKLGFNADLQNSFGKVYITEKREIFNAKNSVE